MGSFISARSHSQLFNMARRESILNMGNLTLCFGGTQKLEKTGFKDVSWKLKCEVVRVIKLWTKMPKCFKASTTQTVFSLSLSSTIPRDGKNNATYWWITWRGSEWGSWNAKNSDITDLDNRKMIEVSTIISRKWRAFFHHPVGVRVTLLEELQEEHDQTSPVVSYLLFPYVIEFFWLQLQHFSSLVHPKRAIATKQ